MSSVALHGNLRDFGIAEVFQLIGQQRKTGVLNVHGEGGEIFLAFDAGRVVRGGPIDTGSEGDPIGRQLVRAGFLTREQLDNLRRESERSARTLPDLLVASGLIQPEALEDARDLLTRETVFDVMRRTGGDFHFTAEPVIHDTPDERLLAAEQILMDGLRMLDEWCTFADVVPSDEAVFRRVGDLEAVRALTMGESDVRMGHAERVLQLVDGRLNVRRIIDLSRIGTFEATRALVELRQAGVIDLVSETRRPAALPATRRRVELGPMLRAAVAMFVPMIAIAAVAWSALDRADATGSLPGSALPVRAWKGLDARYEVQRVRALLEAHRFETGSYPDSLGELTSSDMEAVAASLTRSELDDYYYRVGENGEVVLLAPMF